MLLHAAPAQLHANLHYIANFRHPSRLVGEASYYLTNALSAASFLAELTAAQLTIDAADFEARLDEARRTAAKHAADARGGGGDAEKNGGAENGSEVTPATAAPDDAPASAAPAAANGAPQTDGLLLLLACADGASAPNDAGQPAAAAQEAPSVAAA